MVSASSNSTLRVALHIGVIIQTVNPVECDTMYNVILYVLEIGFPVKMAFKGTGHYC